MADKPLPPSQPSSSGRERPPTGESAALVVGHPTLNQRHPDNRDAMVEMAARAQEISQEAGSKVAAAMKDVIGAAAGLAGFAIESARDLVQYMVRRGQMTQEEADKLMREAEEAYAKRPKPPAPRVADVPKVVARTAEQHAQPAPHVTHAATPAKKAAAPAKKAAKPSRPATKAAKSAPKKSKPSGAASRTKAKTAAKKKK